MGEESLSPLYTLAASVFYTFLHERLYQAMQNAELPRPQVDTWPVYSILEPAVP